LHINNRSFLSFLGPFRQPDQSTSRVSLQQKTEG
jgi:hypothetical protein